MGASPILLEVDVDSMTNQECKGAYGQSAITDAMICAARTTNGVSSDSCQETAAAPSSRHRPASRSAWYRGAPDVPIPTTPEYTPVCPTSSHGSTNTLRSGPMVLPQRRSPHPAMIHRTGLIRLVMAVPGMVKYLVAVLSMVLTMMVVWESPMITVVSVVEVRQLRLSPLLLRLHLLPLHLLLLRLHLLPLLHRVVVVDLFRTLSIC